MTRVFVTGAAGFVGRAAVQRLLARGHAVTGLVRVSDPPPGVEVVRGELLAPDTYRNAITAADVVVHLAAATGKASAAAHV